MKKWGQFGYSGASLDRNAGQNAPWGQFGQKFSISRLFGPWGQFGLDNIDGADVMYYLSNQELHSFLPSFMNVMIMAYIHIARYICTYAVCFIRNCRIQITQFLVPSTFCVFLFFCGKNILCQGPRQYGCSWCFSTHDFPSWVLAKPTFVDFSWALT